MIAAINADESLGAEQKQAKVEQIMADWSVLNQQVLAAGGLYIIGTERHESRRVDNQLRGRAGRQGDPGASRFYLSLDDSLLRIFGGERMRGMMTRLGMVKGEAIEHRLLSRSIESAQRKVEGHNFDIRKQLLEYDDVANAQRKVIYSQRDEVLVSPDLSPMTFNMINGCMGEVFDTYLPPKAMEDAWDVVGLEKALRDEYRLEFDLASKISANPNVDEHVLREEMVEFALNSYQHKLDNFKARVSLEISQFVASMLPEDRSAWNLVALDNFVLQNGGSSEIIFAEKFDPQTAEHAEVLAAFNLVGEQVASLQVTRFERGVLLQHLDHYWREHLTQLEQLRQGIGLRGYAQKDPKQEYKKEAFNLFSLMLDAIKSDIVKVLFTVQLQGLDDVPNDEELFDDVDEQQIKTLHANQPSALSAAPAQAQEQAISRNSPCPCGSGKKFKHCHGKLD
jgi:preprotein translocase subunit SecA